MFTYFKITLAVLKRRKLNTAITLFGICFTVTVITLLAALFGELFTSSYPERHLSRSLYVFSNQEKDLETGLSKVGGFSFYFARKYLQKMETPEKIALVSNEFYSTLHVNNERLNLSIKYTDENFWEVVPFEFTEGRAFSKEDISNNERGIVITNDIKEKIFGEESEAYGKMLTIDGDSYEVTGVVKECSNLKMMTYADVYLPYNTYKQDLNQQQLIGSFRAILLAKDEIEVEKMRSEYSQMLQGVKPPLGNKNVKFSSVPDTPFEAFTRRLLGNKEQSGKSGFLTILFICQLLFMLLPALNLININLNNMIERAPEIAIRRSFGASSRDIFIQFVLENVFITMLGGIIALFVSVVLLLIVNNLFFERIELALNWFAVIVVLLSAMVFSLMSGAYPAWRISKMNVINSLKQSS
jgi:putative ABC transport system permease protein